MTEKTSAAIPDGEVDEIHAQQTDDLLLLEEMKAARVTFLPIHDRLETACKHRATLLARLTALEAEKAALKAEVAGLRDALSDVCNPMNMFRREAAAKGWALSSMAPSLANNTEFVQSIARRALERTSQGEQER